MDKNVGGMNKERVIGLARSYRFDYEGTSSDTCGMPTELEIKVEEQNKHIQSLQSTITSLQTSNNELIIIVSSLKSKMEIFERMMSQGMNSTAFQHSSQVSTHFSPYYPPLGFAQFATMPRDSYASGSGVVKKGSQSCPIHEVEEEDGDVDDGEEENDDE
ncbi:hypothetical protein ACH5RR_021567 [Cinchona calisaya]|uniref:Uncharacterized protein n=1 Tax=Cinchona calisaya TaxID=153742 RepID=A0ABD2ZIX6_9GENT